MDPEDSMSESGAETEELVDEVEIEDASEQINSRCSVKKMCWLIGKLDEERRGFVTEMGFEGILDLQLVTRSNRGFSMWLLKHVDEQASAIDNGHLRFIPFYPKDFGRVLGIPFGGTPVGVDPSREAVSTVRKILGIGETVTKIKAIEEIVLKRYPSGMNQRQKNRFKVAFAICAVTHMLSPMLKGNYFQTFYWCALQNPELISMYDWGSLVRDGILNSARLVKSELAGAVKKTKKTNIAGCTHGLQVFYIDNLELGPANLPHNMLPRVKVYSEKVINRIIIDDQVSAKHADVSVFGRLLPRPDASVCYGRSKSSLLGPKSVSLSTDDMGSSDPLIEKLSAMLLDKVAKYSTTCQDTVARASIKVKEINRLHAEEWASIVEDTNSIISSQTAAMVDDINRVKEVLGRCRKDDCENAHGPGMQCPRTESARDKGFSADKDGNKFSSHSGSRTEGSGEDDLENFSKCDGVTMRNPSSAKDHSLGGSCRRDRANQDYLDNVTTDLNTSKDGTAGTNDPTYGWKGEEHLNEHTTTNIGAKVNVEDCQAERAQGKRMRVKRAASRGSTPKRSNLCPANDNTENEDPDTAGNNLDSLIDAIADEQGQDYKKSYTPGLKRHDTVQEDPEAKRRRMHINTLEVPSMELFSEDDSSPPVLAHRGSAKGVPDCGVNPQRDPHIYTTCRLGVTKNGESNVDTGKGIIGRDTSPEHREMPLSIIPQGSDRKRGKDTVCPEYSVPDSAIRKKDLMAEFCNASSSQGMKEKIDEGHRYVINIPDDPEPSTGLDMVFTPSPSAIGSKGVEDKSPVSRNREVAALELAYREEMENTSLNLNLTDHEDTLSAPLMRWRKVKPGPCARSPFVLGYEPPLRAHSGIVGFYNAFFREKGDNLGNNWIISTQPKYTEISGDLLQSMVREKGSLETEFVNLAMRRYQQIDVAFAAEKNEGCWRLFLEADFANHVFRGDIVTSVKYIYDLFRGPLVTFDVHLCIENVLPVRFEASWSTYIWDFHEKHITILDPTMNNGESSNKVKQTRHDSIALELHKAIGQCIAIFFNGWEPDMKAWPTRYPKGLTLSVCDSNDSGIYALHFARNWTGTRLKTILSSNGGVLLDARMIMLVEMLSLEGNIGHIPEKYRKALCL